jgi:hypothetical protein
MLSFIIALCIISFTAGLIIGIKFASDSKKDIVDEKTRKAVSNIGHKVSNLIKEDTPAVPEKGKTTGKLFPKKEFPYVIRIAKGLDSGRSQEIAGFLSGKGHTVIISRNKKDCNLYTGPYKNITLAQTSLKSINGYSNPEWFSKAAIMRR